jgi:hypothetical protein
MKKLALTSLLAVFAVSGANAANVIDGNPLYRPDKGHFYSETSLETNTDFDNFVLGEEFGYGITDKLAVILNTALSANYPDQGDSNYAWNNFGLGLNYRYLDQADWKADVYGKVRQVYNTGHNFNELETVVYNWTVGTRLGYAASDWTVAGMFEYTYQKDDQNPDDQSTGSFAFGLNGQYAIDGNWNLVGQLTYVLPQDLKETYGNVSVVYPADVDSLHVKIGANYNIDSTKYVGAYIGKQITNTAGDDSFGLGVKFGIDF